MFFCFQINLQTIENFLNRVEQGYLRYGNPYHNNLHAADVAQTVHYMLCQTGLMVRLFPKQAGQVYLPHVNTLTQKPPSNYIVSILKIIDTF